jgi:hypothetical protein
MLGRARSNLLLLLLSFLLLTAAILRQPDWGLMDFDQPFYVTIAYDLDRSQTFSNGIFVDVDSTTAAPRPGMFFGPVYPLLVLAAMKVDPRFAEAVRCSVEADRGHRDPAGCEPYATPIRVLHGLLIALGVLAIACTAEAMFASRAVFWLAGALATAALFAETDIFSFIMTESISFSLYCWFARAMVRAWKTPRLSTYLAAGGLLGLLCLTRLSFLLVFPLAVALSLLQAYWLSKPRQTATGLNLLGMTLVLVAMLGAWAARNDISVGKLGLTEEYGSAVLIERLAYDDMTLHEGLTAFPYCLPVLGDYAFDKIYGTDSMHRFVFHTPGSFFHVGRDRRDELIKEHGRLDPLIGPIARDELGRDWGRHLAVSVPLAWCGLWPGWAVSLFLLPLFAVACVRAARQSQPLLLLYAAPPFCMLGLHALLANHYTRYNIILIAPFSVGAAWVVAGWLSRRRAPHISNV